MPAAAADPRATWPPPPRNVSCQTQQPERRFRYGGSLPAVRIFVEADAQTDDVFSLALSPGPARVRSRSGLSWKGESGYDHSWTRSTEPIGLAGSSARRR